MDQLLRYANQNKQKFFCGDFNIDLLKQETHVGTKWFLNCMYGLGIYPLITNYSANSGLIISDICTYLPIFVLCKCEFEKNYSMTFRNVRSLKKNNILMLMESLRQEKWRSVLYSDDVNIVYANFINTFNTLYNLHCPT